MIEGPELLLFDTSIWVRSLRPRGADDLKAEVRDALAQRRVATCWIVKTEVLIGARDPSAFTALLDTLEGVTDVPMTDDVWSEAARLGYELRKAGIKVPVPDLLIAQCAISSGRTLWHADAGFENVRQRSSLRTRHWQIVD
jgi:predicted nucleic acid-binding protein